ncbi:MAG: TfoX/Sxy family protein [Eggerthellaceae bacterium]
MASTVEYLEHILDLLHEVPCLSHCKMMGEYILYSKGVIFGGIYDDRFLLKDAPAAREAFATEQIPYDGAKPMLLVDSKDPAKLASVVSTMMLQLPKPKHRNSRKLSCKAEGDSV